MRRSTVEWGDPVGRRIDWGLVALIVAWAVAFGLLFHVALNRAGL